MSKTETIVQNKTKAELKVEQDLQIIALIKKWPDRLKALKDRADDPLSVKAFCDRHGLNNGYFNRMKSLEFITTKEKTDPVEAAFRKERV